MIAAQNIKIIITPAAELCFQLAKQPQPPHQLCWKLQNGNDTQKNENCEWCVCTKKKSVWFLYAWIPL